MSGQDEKTNCPNCGAGMGWINSKGDVILPIIDEETGRELKTVKFKEYKCERCKYTWRERW